jgi:hypothetical protein
MGPDHNECMACGRRDPAPRQVFRHHRRGDLDEVLTEANLTDSAAQVVVYRSLATGLTWVRLRDEFYGKAVQDGAMVDRFTLVTP